MGAAVLVMVSGGQYWLHTELVSRSHRTSCRGPGAYTTDIFTSALDWGHPIQSDLILTDYICHDPISKEPLLHILHHSDRPSALCG